MNLNIAITIVLVLLVYWKVRNQYFDRLDTKYRYRLFDLRDKLREFVLDNEVDSESIAYRYLDSSISKTVNKLYCVNFWTLMFFPSKEPNAYEYKEHVNFLKKNVFENSYTGFIYTEYLDLILEYMAKRHYLLMAFAKILFGMAIVSKKVKRMIDESGEQFAFHPKTSSAQEICAA